MKTTTRGIKYAEPADLHPSATWYEANALSVDAAIGQFAAQVEGQRLVSAAVSPAGEMTLTLADNTTASVAGQVVGPANTITGATTNPDGTVTLTQQYGAPVTTTTSLQGPAGPRGESGAAPSPLERLRALRGFGAGRVRVAVVGDSTGNSNEEWVRMFSRRFGATLPTDVRREYRVWDAATSAWKPAVVDATGPQPDLGIIVTDTFSRTGELVGSTPNAGPAWNGLTGAWSADGSAARSTGGLPLSQNMNSRDATLTADFILDATIKSRTCRMYVGSTQNQLGDGFSVILSINSVGALSLTPYKKIGGVQTAMGTATTVAGFTAGAAGQAVRVTVQTVVQNATATVAAGGQTTSIAVAIPEAEVSSLGYWAGLNVPESATTTPFALDAIDIRTPKASGATTAGALFDIWNGSIPGANLGMFDAALRNTMFPPGTPFDVLAVNMGHNHAREDGAAFTATLGAWLDAWRATHPESTVLLMSQNPQVAPAAGGAAHKVRLAALRLWAADRGYAYAPVCETFSARPDGGASLIAVDGVHPSTPPIAGQLDGDYGSVLWTDVLLRAIGT